MKAFTTSAILQSAAAATGDGTALDCGGFATAAIQITGTFTATVTFEATIDGATWVAVPLTNVNSGTAATTATAAGVYRGQVSGYGQLRARISAYTSGSITATGIATTAAI